MMKKISSFTIIELMITLIISAIIISIGYYAFFLFNRQFATYRQRSSQMKAYYLLQTALQHDFEKAYRITDTMENNSLAVYWRDTCVQYAMQDHFIWRRSPSSLDSFPLKVMIRETQYVSDTLRLIQHVLLEVQLNRESVLLTADKIYSSQQLMLAEKIKHD